MSTPRKEVLADGVEIWLGDCRDVLTLIGRVDAVVTDPPYGIAATSGGPESRKDTKGNYAGSFLDTQEYLSTVCAKVIEKSISISRNVVLTPGRTNIWHYPRATDVGCFYQPAASGVSFWGRPTWQPILFYGNAPNSGEQLRALHYVLTEAAEDNGHPCPKPIKAWTWLLSKSTKFDDLVCDPFMGSGTTGVACVNLGRSFIGIEREPKYFDIARQRITEALSRPRLPFDERIIPKQQSMFGEQS